MAAFMPLIGMVCGGVGVAVGGVWGVSWMPIQRGTGGFLLGSALGLLVSLCVSVGLVFLFAWLGWL